MEMTVAAGFHFIFGVVNLAVFKASFGDGMRDLKSSGRRYRSPDLERPRSQEPVMNGLQQMSSDTKEILDETVDR
jgi:hypothetical protein